MNNKVTVSCIRKYPSEKWVKELLVNIIPVHVFILESSPHVTRSFLFLDKVKIEYVCILHKVSEHTLYTRFKYTKFKTSGLKRL